MWAMEQVAALWKFRLFQNVVIRELTADLISYARDQANPRGIRRHLKPSRDPYRSTVLKNLTFTNKNWPWRKVTHVSATYKFAELWIHILFWLRNQAIGNVLTEINLMNQKSNNGLQRRMHKVLYLSHRRSNGQSRVTTHHLQISRHCTSGLQRTHPFSMTYWNTGWSCFGFSWGYKKICVPHQ